MKKILSILFFLLYSNVGFCFSYGYRDFSRGGAKEMEQCQANLCPDSKPIMLENGECRACPIAFESFEAASELECLKCDDRYTYKDGVCQAYSASNCPNREGFWLDDGNCRDCTGNWCRHNISSKKMADCLDACPNRASEDDGWGPSCVLKNYCSGPNQFIDSWGDCKTCGVDVQYWGNCNSSPCKGQKFVQGNYHDDCRRICDFDCCAPGEVYHKTGTTAYGADDWVCCPAARPIWDMDLKACVSEQAYFDKAYKENTKF
ncbi:MAG: hypothetical protein IKS41_04195 [Alphaproteobacteria bacterium]|nr:hypothetical protein [Alphaproteobacteria bacterium]